MHSNFCRVIIMHGWTSVRKFCSPGAPYGPVFFTFDSFPPAHTPSFSAIITEKISPYKSAVVRTVRFTIEKNLLV